MSAYSIFQIITGLGSEIKKSHMRRSCIEWSGRTGGVLCVTYSKEESMIMEKPDQNQTGTMNCGVDQGSLPGCCASLAFPFVPMQEPNPVRYSRMEALQTGTLFPGLDLPFKAAIQAKTKMANTALVELMALDFAVDELGLYLVTHKEDQEVLQLYWSYVKLAKEGREKYQKLYGPLLQTDLTPEDGYAWLKDPWPWDVGGNS